MIGCDLFVQLQTLFETEDVKISVHAVGVKNE
jgi:hypothetical protein